MIILSLIPVRRKNWVIKASVFDDQILVFFHNPLTLAYFFKIFYNEEGAYKFIEEIVVT
jgi:hypothetical protein